MAEYFKLDIGNFDSEVGRFLLHVMADYLRSVGTKREILDVFYNENMRFKIELKIADIEVPIAEFVRLMFHHNDKIIKKYVDKLMASEMGRFRCDLQRLTNRIAKAASEKFVLMVMNNMKDENVI